MLLKNILIITSSLLAFNAFSATLNCRVVGSCTSEEGQEPSCAIPGILIEVQHGKFVNIDDYSYDMELEISRVTKTNRYLRIRGTEDFIGNGDPFLMRLNRQQLLNGVKASGNYYVRNNAYKVECKRLEH